MEELTDREQSLLAVVRNERRRWDEIRRYAAERGDAGLLEAMDAASKRYGERSRGRPPKIDPEYLLRQTELLDALWQIAWHTTNPVVLRIGGTQVNYSIIEAMRGRYEFHPDQQEEVDRIIAWADALRHRQANAPMPGPGVTADLQDDARRLLADGATPVEAIKALRDRGVALADAKAAIHALLPAEMQKVAETLWDEMIAAESEGP